VNGQHFWTFCWLRYRLFVNQLSRGGLANKVILAILAVFAVLFALGAFIGAFFMGLFAMPEASPDVHIYVWDGLTVGLLFAWATGVLTELQRSESLALEKFLHLPVSLWGAFVLNYLSSLLSVTLLLFLPIMVGLILGMIFGVGPSLILVLPLLAAFLLMVTALSYQFQGWLATLMVDKRRRRTVIVVATLVFVGVAQLPNLANIYFLGNTTIKNATVENLKAHQKEAEERAAAIAEIVNIAVPAGWLALGAKAVVEGNLLTAALCLCGMTFIGVFSLRRSYRTTLRLYTGQYTAGRKTDVAAQPTASAAPRLAADGSRMVLPNMLEKHLPWLPEQAAVIALAGFRSFLRAPEVKMILLSPILMLLIVGGIYLRSPWHVDDSMRPFMTFGALLMSLVFLMNLLSNQFGFDRGGFRIFVLSPASRRDILLGKNLAVVPFALIFNVLMIGALLILYPMSLEHSLAVIPQAVSMYLLCCMQVNCVSILAPIQIPPGAMRPRNVKMIPVLLHLLTLFTLPLTLSFTLLPLAGENMLHLESVPVCLALSVVLCAGIVVLYYFVLGWQGRWLQYREQKILETVTEKAA